MSYGNVDLGLGTVSGGGGVGADGYIGRYGPGVPGWVQRIVGPGEDKIVGSASGPGSTIYGVGWFEATATFNGAQLTSVGGRDVFFSRFNAVTGTVDLTKQYGGTGRDEISGADSSGGALVLAGFFDDTLAFGGTAPEITSIGALDVWVAKFDTSGAGVWAVRFGGAGNDRNVKLGVDKAGDIYIAGEFQNQVAFGAFPLVSVGGIDAFIVKLHGNDGTVAWATSFGSAGDDGIWDVMVDAAGHVAVAGTVGGSLAGGPPSSDLDAVVAAFDAATGKPRWRNVYATALNDRASALTLGRNGDVYACLSLGPGFDFGSPIIGETNPASVLLRIAP